MSTMVESRRVNHVGPRWRRRLVGCVRLAKVRVYQHLYECLAAAALIVASGTPPSGSWIALVGVTVAVQTMQYAACAIDDIVGFLNGSDAANLAAAEESGERPLPKPLVSGHLTLTEAIVFAAVASGVCLLAGLAVLVSVGRDTPVAVIVLFLAVFALAIQYSWGLRLSYRPGGLEFVIFTVNSATIVLTYWLIVGKLTTSVILVGTLFGLWFVLLVSYGNLADRDGDRRSGRRTLATTRPASLVHATLAVVVIATFVIEGSLVRVGLIDAWCLGLLVPASVVHISQLYLSAVRGQHARAFRAGFGSIDMAAAGLVMAILMS